MGEKWFKCFPLTQRREKTESKEVQLIDDESASACSSSISGLYIGLRRRRGKDFRCCCNDDFEMLKSDSFIYQHAQTI
jgi:hypothetical protein